MPTIVVAEHEKASANPAGRWTAVVVLRYRCCAGGYGSGSHERRVAGPEVDFDIAAALDEAAQTMAKIPEDIQTPVTERLQRQITSLAERAIPISPHR